MAIDHMRKKRGFSLVVIAVTLTVMVGMLGISVDLGRVYTTKNELQAFADSAAVSAAYELNGTSAGITAAKNVGAEGPGSGVTTNKWYFGTKAVTGAEVEFATTANGPWLANPSSGTGYRFTRVTTQTDLGLYFLPVLKNLATSQLVKARAIAGQTLTNSIGNGAEPFSPDAHDNNDADFGFTVGQLHTIKWAPPGQRKKSSGRCPGDLAPFEPGGGSSDRGYIDIGQGNGNSALHDAIVNGNYALSSPLTIGSIIDTVPGNKHVGPAIHDRFHQDTDQASTTFAAYHGNGRRLFVLPVNNRDDQGVVLGFGLFLIQSNTCGNNNDPCCATYVGNTMLNTGSVGGASTPGLYQVKLIF